MKDKEIARGRTKENKAERQRIRGLNRERKGQDKGRKKICKMKEHLEAKQKKRNEVEMKMKGEETKKSHCKMF